MIETFAAKKAVCRFPETLPLSPVPLDLTFWGVRGSVPTPVAANLGFGGNTACLTIRYDDQPLLIFDAGSGIRTLGNTLTDASVHLFLTHFHWDHIQGLPYFVPIYDPNRSITVHSSVDPTDLERILSAQMKPPYYPVEPPKRAFPTNKWPMATQIGDLVDPPLSSSPSERRRRIPN